MAKLTAKARAKLPASAFAGPGRSYPIEDKAHAKAAKMLSFHAGPVEKKKIDARASKVLGKALKSGK